MKIKLTELQKIEREIDDLLEELSIWQTQHFENDSEYSDDLEDQISQLMYEREALDW